jgi:hypothetical protein
MENSSFAKSALTSLKMTNVYIKSIDFRNSSFSEFNIENMGLYFIDSNIKFQHVKLPSSPYT